MSLSPNAKFSKESRTFGVGAVLVNGTLIFNQLLDKLLNLTLELPSTIIAEFANTIDPDENSHNEPCHLYL